MFEEKKSDSENLTGCLPGLGILALVTFGIGSCVNSNHQSDLQYYRDVPLALKEKLNQHYPEGSESLFVGSPHDVKDSLVTAETALAAYGDLLSVSGMHSCDDNLPAINQLSKQPVARTGLRQEWAQESAEFKEAVEASGSIRHKFSQTLKDCREALQTFQSSPTCQNDRTINHYVANLVPRLDRLAANIESGDLMVSGNVLHTTFKSGSYERMIGKVDDYEDARLELRALREYLERAETPPAEAE